MKVTYTWLLIYSCLLFGSGIFGNRKLGKRQSSSSFTKYPDEKFSCSDGLYIQWSWVCDGRKDCSDGSDEIKEFCAQYEYGPNMNTSCGRVYINNDNLIDNDEKSLVGTLPWQVGILKLNNDYSTFDLICAGSIITPILVISAARCFVQSNLSDKPSIIKQYIFVVAGNYSKHMVDDDSNQILEVDTYYIKESYFNLYDIFAEDIAIIVLVKKMSFNNVIAPVCIDWNSMYSERNGDQGKVVLLGWKNSTRDIFFLESSLPYINPNTCRNMSTGEFKLTVTFDKFCTHHTLGQRILKENFGSGISFLHNNSYYLTGILSTSDNLKNDTVLSFIDIKHTIDWIRIILNKYFTMNYCFLPNDEGVVYSYEGSNERLSPGTLINKNQIVIENCEIGYHKVYNGYRICLGKGKWLSTFEKLCLKMCPPLESDSLDIHCSYNGNYSNCSTLSIPDTIATPSCKPTYTAPSKQDENMLELLCQSNGTWNRQLYKCNPYCGREYISNQVLIRNGEKVQVGTAPWNVGIYHLDKINSNYNLICGGSIISPNLVISAAHCFWKKGMLSKNISINDDLYKIGVGKYDRNFTIIDNEFTQIINVKMIYLNDGYYGPTGFHAEDISIIVLQNRLSFSNGVAPVCIDWNGKYNVGNGDLGKIVGWGKTEKGISSPILFETSLSYINHSSCRNMYTNGFEPYVTVDKFCAGTLSGQGVSQEYSGAGLSFLHSDSYYLTGILSIKDPNRNSSIAAFIEVKSHIQWIRRLYIKYN